MLPSTTAPLSLDLTAMLHPLSCSDSCHLPHSRLTDRWMSATSGAMGLSSATPVNLTHTHTHIYKHTKHIYRHPYGLYTHTPPSSTLCSDSNPHKDTLSKPLPFHFLSPCAVDPTARGFEICFFFSFFFWSVFFPI